MSDAVSPSPLVSVIVTTFNRASLLRETIESILAQTFHDFELLVVDNLSTDSTAHYVISIDDSRVRYFCKGNGGLVAVNRNFGVSMARGRYVAFCDDDDLWTRDKLASQVALMEADPEIALCCTANTTRFSDGSERPSGSRDGGPIAIGRLYLRNIVATSSTLIKADVFRELGGFNQGGTLSPYEDYELWLRLAHQHKSVLLPRHLLIYRVHGRNLSPIRLSGIRLVIRVLLSMRKTIGAHGYWYWSCVLARVIQYGGLYAAAWLSGRRVTPNA